MLFALFHQTTDNFDDFLFAAFDIGGVLPDNFALTVKDEGVGDVDYVHGSFEVLVLVKIDFVFPFVAVNMRLDTGGGTGIVDGDSDQFDTCFILPIFIDLLDSVEFAVARFAPSGPETDDDRFAVVLDG